MADEKDRLGDKLRQRERAEEERYFNEQEKAAVERLRRDRAATTEDDVRALARMRCPKCGEPLVTLDHHDVTVEECPTCRGMWIDAGELETLAKREHDSWLGRFFFRPRR